MIEALKSDELIDRVGGRFKLTSLIQKRWLELVQGARPLVEVGDESDIEVIIREILEGKIAFDEEGSDGGEASAEE